jgi:hypothetical protein
MEEEEVVEIYILHMMIYSFDGAEILSGKRECVQAGNPSVPYLEIHDSPAIIY